MKVKVCDAIMGSGKTQAAIVEMDRCVDRRYMFITPYLNECERVCAACEKRGFQQPQTAEGSKLESLHSLLKSGINIASTHALFYYYSKETRELIRQGHYHLILDEVVDTVKLLDINKNDVKSLLASDFIEIDPETTQVTWKDKRYNGQWQELRQQIERGYVTYSQDKLLLWMMPIEVFEAFESVTILTYMFEGQYLYCYCQLNDIDIDYIGVRHVDGLNYEFTDKMVAPRITLPSIHLYSRHKLNAIGDDRLALSHSWFSKSDPKLIRKLANNTVNFFRHKCDAPAICRFWSAPSAFKDALRRKSFQSPQSFVPHNARAVNAYRHCYALAYLINIFPNPKIVSYFKSYGIQFNNNALATSTMVQWLWRSRLRCGQEIWLYLPSSHMRKLLYKWVKDVTGNVECIEEWE